MQPISELSLAVLCGGASRRMGVAKATLSFGGEAMVTRMLRRLGAVCGAEHFVVAAGDQILPPLPESIRVLRDRAPGRGPLEGVIVATQAVRAMNRVTAVAIVGCDLPWFEPSLLRAMYCEMQTASDVVVVRDELRYHPLVAIYRPHVCEIAERRLAAGQGSLHGLIESLNSQTVDLDFVRAVDPSLRSLLNVNTPAEYERALAMLPDEGAAAD